MEKFIVFTGSDGVENVVSPNLSAGLSVEEIAALVVPVGVSYSVVNKKGDALATQARSKRNTLLAASDWTQVADAPVDQAAWATYRQALRDITSQEGFPEAITWPVAPN